MNNTDVACIVETWHERDLKIAYKDYQIIDAKAHRTSHRGRASSGIIIFVKRKFKVKIIEINCYWIIVKLELNHVFSVVLGAVYLPPDSLGDCFGELSNKLQEAVLGSGADHIILMGDFNARLASMCWMTPELLEGSCLSACRRSFDSCVNARGRACLSFMEAESLVLVNGRSASDKPANFTYVSERGQSTIDLCMVSVGLSHSILDSGIVISNATSDHIPYFLDISANSMSNESPPHRYSALKTKYCFDSRLTPFYNRLLFDTFSEEEISNLDLESKSELLISGIKATAGALGMSKEISQNSSQYSLKPWFNKDCKCKKTSLNRALRAFKSSNFSNSKLSDYIIAKKTYKDMLRQAKTNYYNGLRLNLSRPENSIVFWKTVKTLLGAQKRASAAPLGCEEVHEHFKNTFSIHEPMETPPTVERKEVDCLDCTISMEELNSALERCKLGKAPGPDGLNNEFYKSMSVDNREYILELFNQTLSEEQTPQNWSNMSMFLIHKKGDPTMPSNYRGISLVNSLCKIFSSVLANRINSWAEEFGLLKENQSGFRKGRNCSENVFVLSSCINNRIRLRGGKMFGLFVDFKQAFDRINHDKLWTKLLAFGMSSKMVNVLKSFYSKANVSVQVNDVETSKIDIQNGVLQGDPLSPLLFSLYLSDFDDFMQERGSKGISIDDSNELRSIFYADDLVILSYTSYHLQKNIDLLCEYSRVNFLEINTDKTKVMVFRKSGPIKRNLSFQLNAQFLEIVKQYTYLGVVFSSSGLFLKAAETMVAKANVAAAGIRALFSKTDSESPSSIRRLFETSIRPVLLYGSEIWGLEKERVIERCQLQFYKRLYFLHSSTPGYILRTEFGLRSVISSVLKRALKFFEKVMQMEDVRLPKICLLRQLELMQGTETKYNWLKQLIGLLEEADITENSLRASDLSRERIQEILSKFDENRKRNDIERAKASMYCPGYKFVLDSGEERQFVELMSLKKARLLYQIKLSNSTFQHLFSGGVNHSFETSSVCRLCCLGELDTIEHLIVSCPVLNVQRVGLLESMAGSGNGDCLGNLERVIGMCSSFGEELNKLILFVIGALRKRGSLLNM